MIERLSNWLLLRLMKHRAERHSGCSIDLLRLRSDPEYADAIRMLAQFTLDSELRAMGALATRSSGQADKGTDAGLRAAQVIPLRRAAA
ncbi:MAG: hypothetical protein JNM79_08850 [Burkholderiales bacterium]|nr:hypothetical protein [Burkholderiales bacterium]